MSHNYYDSLNCDRMLFDLLLLPSKTGSDANTKLDRHATLKKLNDNSRSSYFKFFCLSFCVTMP